MQKIEIERAGKAEDLFLFEAAGRSFMSCASVGFAEWFSLWGRVFAEKHRGGLGPWPPVLTQLDTDVTICPVHVLKVRS